MCCLDYVLRKSDLISPEKLSVPIAQIRVIIRENKWDVWSQILCRTALFSRVIQCKFKSVHFHKVQFFSFSQDNDSVLNSEEGRQRLKNVGIDTPRRWGSD